MDDLTPIHLTVSIPSLQNPDHLHAEGSGGILVEHLGADAYLIEIRVPDGALEGDAWFETLEVYEHEFEVIAELDSRRGRMET